MLAWIVFVVAVVAVVAASLFVFALLRRHVDVYAASRAHRHLVAHTQHLTPYTEQHAEELERRVERLRDTSREQTSTLQDALESLRAGRRHRREG